MPSYAKEIISFTKSKKGLYGRERGGRIRGMCQQVREVVDTFDGTVWENPEALDDDSNPSTDKGHAVGVVPAGRSSSTGFVVDFTSGRGPIIGTVGITDVERTEADLESVTGTGGWKMSR